MKSLVWRYVSAMHRRDEESAVTEDDVNEVKMEISSMRYEILEVFEKNGMDISGAEKKEKTVLAKKMKVWERRLMKDFHVAGQAQPQEDEDEEQPAENETGLSRFKRAALKVATNSASSKWGQVMSDVGVVTNSQIGRCRNRQSFKNQQNLQRAMEEARRLVARSPVDRSGAVTPVDLPEDDTLMKLLKNIAEELQEVSPGHTLAVDKNPGKKGHSRSTTPVSSQLLQDILTGKSPLPAVRKSPLPGVVTKEIPCKSQAPVNPPIQEMKSPTPSRGKRPDTPKSVTGVTSPPPPLIHVTHHETTVEEPEEDHVKPVKSPSPKPPRAAVGDGDCNQPLPKKRTAPTPDSAAVSRPVGQKPTNQGMIPPPPSRKDEPPQESITVSVVKPPPADSIITMPRCESPLPTIVSISTTDDNMTITMESGRGSSTGSTDKLVPTSPSPSGSAAAAAPRTTPSPACLRPVRRIEDVTTIKRQPKSGWL